MCPFTRSEVQQCSLFSLSGCEGLHQHSNCSVSVKKKQMQYILLQSTDLSAQAVTSISPNASHSVRLFVSLLLSIFVPPCPLQLTLFHFLLPLLRILFYPLCYVFPLFLCCCLICLSSSLSFLLCFIQPLFFPFSYDTPSALPHLSCFSLVLVYQSPLFKSLLLTLLCFTPQVLQG